MVWVLAGCQSLFKDDIISRDAEETFSKTDRRIKEDRTFSGLTRLKESVAAYDKAENKIPARLEDLIPKYLAEMPAIELSISAHKDTTEAFVYPRAVLRDGRVDGSRISDTGRWGYVFNDQQAVVFVDCTHKSSRGKPWYLER